jgi:hypothetical protein
MNSAHPRNQEAVRIRIMRRFSLPALLLLSACGQPDEQTEQDEHTGAAVDTKEGPQPLSESLTPQQIAFTDIEQSQFFGAGCAFLPEGREGYDPVLYTVGERGLIKLENKLITLAADAGSAEFPYGTRDAYAGGGYRLGLTRGGGQGELAGEESVRWTGSLAIRDQSQRIVYQSAGTLECGA